jgi:hypothetical protein
MLDTADVVASAIEERVALEDSFIVSEFCNADMALKDPPI